MCLNDIISYYKLGLVFLVLAIISFGYINIVVTEVIAEIWERVDIPTTKVCAARYMRSDDETGCKQASSLARLPKAHYLEARHNDGKGGRSKLKQEVSL